MQLDHLILAVNDVEASIRFFGDILGLPCEGQAGPFSVIRVSPDLTLQLAPWGTTGGVHLAFSPLRRGPHGAGVTSRTGAPSRQARMSSTMSR